MQDDHHQRHQHIGAAHDWHQYAGDGSKPLPAAENAKRRHHRQNSPGDQGRAAVEETVSGKGVHQVEGCHQVEAHHVGQNQQHREQRRQPPAAYRRLDVVGRAAPAAAPAVMDLIDLRQGALHKGGGPAQQGDDPHPKHGPHAAQT